jgi:tetratricopeptide (TPR) repeat protein
VSYAEYRSDEYAWGWSLVRFLRRGKKGTLWAPLLEQMKALSGSAPTDGENRRFLRALGYGSDEAFDEDWYAHILALEPEEKTPLGTSKETLAAVAAVKKPTPEQATLLARLGRSFAASGMSEPAAVYLAAALRGGRDAVDLHLLLAEALAANAGRDEDEAWPDDAFGHLERAAAIDPLSAMVRLGLGRQMLLRAKSKDDVAAARDVLGLGLILLGPADDAKALARWALEATLRSEPDLTPSNALARLEAAAPVATGALRSAWIASLQEREAWNVLLQELGARLEAGTADFEERVTLAGLFEASDQAERAAPLYRALLDERPAATYLWPRLVRALVAARRLDEAKAAKARALRILAEAPSLAPLRRTVERIRIR